MTVYVAPGGAAVVQENVPSVLNYGADPTGVADSSAAFNAMGAAGDLIYAPDGDYLINNATVELAGKTLKGDGIQATTLTRTAANGEMLTVTPTSSHLQAEISDLTINHTSTPTSGSSILMSGNGGGLRAHHFQILNPYNAIELSATDGGWTDLCALSDFRIYGAVNYGLWCHDNPNPITASDFVIWMASSAAGTGIYLQNQIAAFVGENGEVESGVYGLFAASSNNTFGHRPENCRFTDVFFDSASGSTFGGVYLVQMALAKFENCWFAATGANCNGAYLGAVDDVAFSNCEFALSQLHGCYVSSSSKHTRFKSCSFIGNGAAASNTYDGLHFQAGTTDFAVSDCVSTSGNGVIGAFGSGTQRYGIAVESGASDRYSIVNNLVSGNGTGGVSDGGSGSNKTVSANY